MSIRQFWGFLYVFIISFTQFYFIIFIITWRSVHIAIVSGFASTSRFTSQATDGVIRAHLPNQTPTSCAGLRDWKAEDDPWYEHFRYSFNCKFVLDNRGKEFVKLIQLALDITQKVWNLFCNKHVNVKVLSCH